MPPPACGEGRRGEVARRRRHVVYYRRRWSSPGSVRTAPLLIAPASRGRSLCATSSACACIPVFELLSERPVILPSGAVQALQVGTIVFASPLVSGVIARI